LIHITDQNDIRLPRDGPKQVAHERDVYHRAFIDNDEITLERVVLVPGDVTPVSVH
jgi:hypothetical protein